VPSPGSPDARDPGGTVREKKEDLRRKAAGTEPYRGKGSFDWKWSDHHIEELCLPEIQGKKRGGRKNVTVPYSPRGNCRICPRGGRLQAADKKKEESMSWRKSCGEERDCG